MEGVLLLPVSVINPSEADWVPVADQIICHIPAWKLSDCESTVVLPEEISEERKRLPEPRSTSYPLYGAMWLFTDVEVVTPIMGSVLPPLVTMYDSAIEG